MRFLQGFAVAVAVHDAEIKHSETGAPYVEVLVQFDKHAGARGVPYAQRITFRSFVTEDIERCPMIRTGAIVGFEGTVDAIVIQKNGRVFANPRVTGRILQVAEVGA